MTPLAILWTAGLALLVLAVMFIPLERSFPAKSQQPVLRAEWTLDLCYFLGQYLVWGALTLEVLGWTAGLLDWLVPARLREAVSAQSALLQAAAAIALGDLAIYWIHRLQHQIGFLWRFHAVHHTPTELDWLAAHREHPLDGVITQVAINLPALALGINLQTLAWLVAFRGIWAVLIHSNVKLPLGPLKYLIGSPELHRWHHARQRGSCNYANLCPIMDLIFGTYFAPPREPAALGLEFELPKSYSGQLLQPLWQRSSSNTAQQIKRDPGLDVSLSKHGGSHIIPD